MYLSLNPRLNLVARPGEHLLRSGLAPPPATQLLLLSLLFFILKKMLSSKLAKKVLLRAVKMGLFDNFSYDFLSLVESASIEAPESGYSPGVEAAGAGMHLSFPVLLSNR